MDIDRDHIDEVILALLFLGRHDGMRTWKSFDWGAMERLHTKGLISDPVGKAKRRPEPVRSIIPKTVRSWTRSLKRVSPNPA
jgi:Domain of unknown function (DUF6429)